MSNSASAQVSPTLSGGDSPSSMSSAPSPESSTANIAAGAGTTNQLTSAATDASSSTSGFAFQGTVGAMQGGPRPTGAAQGETIPNGTQPTVPVPTRNGEYFNSTIAITLNSTSPMLDLDVQTPFKIDEATGYRTYADRRSGQFTLRYVGVGYGLNGTSEFRPGASTEYATPSPASNELYTLKGQPLNTTWPPGEKNLGEASGLDLASYQLDVTFGFAANITFHNATIVIPIKTQAPDFESLKSQAETLSVVQNADDPKLADVSPSMTATVCTVSKDLATMFNISNEPPRVFEIPLFGPKYIVRNETLLLRNSTELAYKLPMNTSLVEVLGPVGSNEAWLGDSECYAVLNPRPSWWLPFNFPRSVSRKAVNAVNQTMFLFPLDPSVEYEVRVGGLGRETSCPVSAIRTYPFHYDYSANIASTNTTNSTDPNPSAEAASSSSSKSKTPIIVGVVVGVVGGIILLGLAAWFLLRRRRKRRQEREKALLPEPFANSASGQARTKAELERMARGEAPIDQSEQAVAATAQPGDDLAAEPRRRIVQEEDGQTIVEYLPPQYRDDWQAGAAPGSSPSSEPRNDVSLSMRSEDRQLAGPAGPPFRDPALDNKMREMNADQPPLKQEYARAFPRALPRPPQTVPSPASGSAELQQARAGIQSASNGDLKEEYKRRFGSSAQSLEGQDALLSSRSDLERMSEKDASPGLVDSADQGGPQHHQEGLKGEYKRWFS